MRWKMSILLLHSWFSFPFYWSDWLKPIFICTHFFFRVFSHLFFFDFCTFICWALSLSNTGKTCTPEERSSSHLVLQQCILWLVWVFLVSITLHRWVLMRNTFIYSLPAWPNEKSWYLHWRNVTFLTSGRLISDWLLIQCLNGHLERCKMFPNKSECLTSLRKIQGRYKGRTDETQRGADEALADAWRALAAWTPASQELWLLWGLSAFELDAHTG